MSLRRARQPKLSLWHALLACALPSACATEVQQDFADGEDPSGAGSGSGGALITGGGAGVIPMPKAGSSSGGNGGSGVTNPFGGSSSSGGKASAGSGGMSSDGGVDNEGGSAGKATGGTGGGTGGSTSGGTGGGGSGACGCMKTLAWADNTVLNWGTGDCLTVAGKTYKYVGTKAQTWANKDCNPTMQLAWCTDSGNDYKFMICQ